MKNESFVVYRSIWNAINSIGDEELGKEIALEVLRYGFEGVIKSKNPTIIALMTLAKPGIDSAKIRYAKKVRSKAISTDRDNDKYDTWRRAVYKRDKYVCQKCGKTDCEVHAHHIENWSTCIKKRYWLSNGITLCKECHEEFHKKYGKGNNNKKQLKEFLKT